MHCNRCNRFAFTPEARISEPRVLHRNSRPPDSDQVVQILKNMLEAMENKLERDRPCIGKLRADMAVIMTHVESGFTTPAGRKYHD